MKVMTKIVPVLGFLEFLRQLLGISAIRILKITYPTYPLLKDPKGPAALPSISEGLQRNRSCLGAILWANLLRLFLFFVIPHLLTSGK